MAVFSYITQKAKAIVPAIMRQTINFIFFTDKNEKHCAITHAPPNESKKLMAGNASIFESAFMPPVNSHSPDKKLAAL